MQGNVSSTDAERIQQMENSKIFYSMNKGVRMWDEPWIKYPNAYRRVAGVSSPDLFLLLNIENLAWRREKTTRKKTEKKT